MPMNPFGPTGGGPRHFGVPGHRPGIQNPKGSRTPSPPKKLPHGGKGPGAPPGGDTSGGQLPDLPPLECFLNNTMDVYTYTTTRPLPDANRRYTGLGILVTGTFLEGTRSRITASVTYTHIILCDPGIEIRDAYTHAGSASTPGYDLLTLPSGQKNNLWTVQFSFITHMAGLGRRKVICADRGSDAVGDWTKLL